MERGIFWLVFAPPRGFAGQPHSSFVVSTAGMHSSLHCVCGCCSAGLPPPENPRGEKKGNVGGWGIEKGKKGEAQRRFLRHQCLEIPFGCELGLML